MAGENPFVVSLEIRRGEVTQRMHTTLLRDSTRAAAEHHVAFHLPRHFEDNPSTRPGGAYGYKRRAPKYLESKRRKVGHETPNVFTGRMRIAVLGGSRITSTSTRGAVIHLRNYFPMTTERWAEIKAITPGELRTLTQVAHRYYRENAAKNRAQRIHKITA
jgi:hypothetical protein